MTELPDDPFDGPDADVLLIGRIVLGSLVDATFRDGLRGLYSTVAGLQRRELVPGVLAVATDTLTGAELLMGEPATDGADADEVEPGSRTEGERVLSDILRVVLRAGIGGVHLEIAVRDDRELRAILRDKLESAWVSAHGGES